jgi:adenylate cyclase
MSAGDQSPNWEAEGLLEGLESDAERAGRHELLDRLYAEGCSLDELRAAVGEDRLVLLPLEKLLLRERRYTIADIVERTGLPREYLEADWRAIGMTAVDDDQPVADEAGIRNLTAVKYLLDAGVPEQRMIELTRMVGDASAKVADAALRIFAESMLQPGDTESDLSLRIVDLANAVVPQLGELLRSPMELHLAEIVRREAITRVERERGFVPGARPVAVCFADMVGFTPLSERLEPRDLSDVTQRFVDLAGDVATPPVRLIKTIGDEAMLASQNPEALVDAALKLIDAAEGDDVLPPLRAGAAAGDALGRAGDWYGRPVNLAARITEVAGGGVLIGDAALREATREAFSWSEAGRRGFKGIEGEVDLYRVERSTG